MHTASPAMGILGAALLLMNGCGTDEELDLSALPIADEENAALLYGSNDFLWTRPSALQVECIRAPCESHVIYDVNLDRIQMIYAFDLRALKYPNPELILIEGSFSTMLLYGRYAIARAFGESVRIFQITRANSRVSEASIDNPAFDRYYIVNAGDPSCQNPPCETWTTHLMNWPQLPSEEWSSLDLGALRLTPEEQQRLLSELQNGTAYLSATNVSVRPVPITEAFRPLFTALLP